MSEQFKSIETTELVKIANAIRTKTGTTDKISLEDMPAKIAAIEGGVALPELENEGAAADLLSGKELIDDEGNVVTGTFTIDSELTAQDDLINQITVSLKNKATGNVNIDEELSIQDDLIAQIQIALNNKINGNK